MSEEERLEPCPFCLSDCVSLGYATSQMHPDAISSRFVECEDCAAMGPAVPDAKQAVKLWNRRPEPNQ